MSKFKSFGFLFFRFDFLLYLLVFILFYDVNKKQQSEVQWLLHDTHPHTYEHYTNPYQTTSKLNIEELQTYWNKMVLKDDNLDSISDAIANNKHFYTEYEQQHKYVRKCIYQTVTIVTTFLFVLFLFGL